MLETSHLPRRHPSKNLLATTKQTKNHGFCERSEFLQKPERGFASAQRVETAYKRIL